MAGFKILDSGVSQLQQIKPVDAYYEGERLRSNLAGASQAQEFAKAQEAHRIQARPLELQQLQGQLKTAEQLRNQRTSEAAQKQKAAIKSTLVNTYVGSIGKSPEEQKAAVKSELIRLKQQGAPISDADIAEVDTDWNRVEANLKGTYEQSKLGLTREKEAGKTSRLTTKGNQQLARLTAKITSTEGINELENATQIAESKLDRVEARWKQNLITDAKKDRQIAQIEAEVIETAALIAGRQSVANTGAESRKDVAGIHTQSKEKIATARDTNRLNVVDLKAFHDKLSQSSAQDFKSELEDQKLSGQLILMNTKNASTLGIEKLRIGANQSRDTAKYARQRQAQATDLAVRNHWKNIEIEADHNAAVYSETQKNTRQKDKASSDALNDYNKDMRRLAREATMQERKAQSQADRDAAMQGYDLQTIRAKDTFLKENATINNKFKQQEAVLDRKSKRALQSAKMKTIKNWTWHEDMDGNIFQMGVDNNNTAYKKGVGALDADYVETLVDATPEQVRAQQSEKSITKVNAKQLEGVYDEGTAARKKLGHIEALNVLSEQADDGALAPIAQWGSRFLLALGVDMDSAQIATNEALNTEVLKYSLGYVGETSGAVSDKEMELFAAASPQLSMTKAGRRLMLAVAMRLEQRKVDAALYLEDIIKTEGRIPVDIQTRLNKRFADQAIFTQEEMDGVLGQSATQGGSNRADQDAALERLLGNKY